MIGQNMLAMAKICGIKTDAALDAALDGGAIFVGFVFYPNSPRNIALSAAAELAKRARSKADVVALLVDPDDALLREVMDRVAPDFVQLHGAESVERVAEIRRIADRPVIKAIGVSQPGDASAALGYVDAADVILFDAKPPRDVARPGGHGVAFDWSLLDEAINHQNWPPDMRWMLSGGLTPENVEAAIASTGAPVVDVSSGVESKPGVKAPELIRRFLEAVKTAKQAAAS